MTSTGYIVFGHGSTVESANDAVRAMAAELSQRGGYPIVETAFLESGKPDLRGAVEILLGRGIRHVIVIPYFLTLGMHLQRDLPRLVEEIRAAHPGLEIHVTPPLDGHPALIDALVGRAREAAPKGNRLQAKLIEWTEIAPGVRHFVFEAPELTRLDFIPGQFVSLTDAVDSRAITRAYSIASAPVAGSRFELCLNRVDDGAFSPHLFDLSPGDVVDMQPPLGTFTLRQPLRDSLLIATGTGIAPFRSMLKAVLRPDAPSFTLLFGVRFESHLLYRLEFEEMALRYPQFRFWPTLTQPGPGWTGRNGRVQAHLAEAIDGRRDIDIYLCGLRPMVDDVRQILKAMGFDRKQIRYEKYD